MAKSNNGPAAETVRAGELPHQRIGQANHKFAARGRKLSAPRNLPPRNRPPGTAPPNGCTVRMFELPGPAVKNADDPPKNCVSKRNRSNVTSRPDKYSVSNCCW